MRTNTRMNEFTDMKLDESPLETKSYIEKMNKGIMKINGTFGQLSIKK